MLEKWERQPMRIGLLVGFLALPVAWWLRDALLQLVFSFSPTTTLHSRLLGFFSMGAIPGAVLGAGISSALFELRRANRSAAKRHLLTSGVLVAALHFVLVAPALRTDFESASLSIDLFGSALTPQNAILLGQFFASLPFHCALLALFVGFFLRARS